MLNYVPSWKYHFTACKEHKLVAMCACGLNAVCFSCGEGRGSSPCKCLPAPRTLGLGLGSAWMSDDFDAPMDFS